MATAPAAAHTGRLPVRTAFLLSTLIAAVMRSGPSFAIDVSVGKHSIEEIKAVCEKMGGRFSQGAAHYDCGTNCHGGPGTDCIVGCNTADQSCIAQVSGGRRATTLQNALQAPARRAR
jgi:hypothetical protein